MSAKNRLSHETSPYLKQHEDNPVDWYPWGEEALQRSRKENKPILLSVGYSSCHWCHVMAHESFENPAIASIMNEHFICVKVDREERPDLDMIYQPVAQVFTRGGGWPLTVFLTPDLKPFYGGTYFPPQDKYGRPGFPKVLMALAKGYAEDRSEIDVRAEKITEVIRNSADVGDVTPHDGGALVSDHQMREGLIASAQSLVEYIDKEHGGVGFAPKFPNTSALSFLWRMTLCSWVPETNRKDLREGVFKSLDGMARGGIFDQIGGGFHRYSVDAEWVIPHFEKMLYDNGLLLKLYSEVICQGGEHLSKERAALYQHVLSKTVDWLEREMLTPEGLFYSALDADSLNSEKHLEEGAYYTWAEDEFSGTEEENAMFKQMLTGLTEESRHALTLQKFPAGAESNPKLVAFLDKLNSIRVKRVRPGLDDKVLSSWTSLTISGLAWASLALNSQKPRKLAINAWNSMKKLAIDSNDNMFSTIQKGKGKFKAYLDDEAFFLQATLDLVRANPEAASEYYGTVRERVPYVIKHFHDEKRGGFYFNRHDQEKLIHQPKNFYDQAIPSGNGVMLSVLTSIESTHAASDFTFLARSNEMNLFQNAFGMSEILSAMLLRSVGPVKVEGEASREVLSHPFCVWEKKTEVEQYCVGQTCHRGKFSPATYF